MIFIFILFFGMAFYFNMKQENLKNEMMNEINKYIKEGNDEGKEIQELQ